MIIVLPNVGLISLKHYFGNVILPDEQAQHLGELNKFFFCLALLLNKNFLL